MKVHLAARIADDDGIAVGNFEGQQIIRMRHHVGRPSRFTEPGVLLNVEFRKVRAGDVVRRNGVASVGVSVTAQWSGHCGMSPTGPREPMVETTPAACFQFGLKRYLPSGKLKPFRKCAVSNQAATSNQFSEIKFFETATA